VLGCQLICEDDSWTGGCSLVDLFGMVAHRLGLNWYVLCMFYSMSHVRMYSDML